MNNKNKCGYAEESIDEFRVNSLIRHITKQLETS